MATVILDTGILDLPTDIGVAEGARTILPLERQIYPSLNNEQSLISVQPGNMVVVTAYGGASDTLAKVFKVLLAEPIVTKVVNTCGLEPVRAETIILAEAEICNKDMGRCAPMTTLDVPGVYRIGVLDGDVTVTAVAHPLQK